MAEKDTCVAYLLWFFLGFLGAHRFYLEKWCTAIIYLFTFGVFGIGWLVDICLIPGMVEEYNDRYRSNVTVVSPVVVVQPGSPVVGYGGPVYGAPPPGAYAPGYVSPPPAVYVAPSPGY
eukprot:TRINITY_DN3258_c0_g1_i3.p2 TRINITY_DN3258_c0_g1~~TRINITY_DN3258_c0_g1_i3.p2  ORF type:complete len:119 (+),score=29.48 TRINITY_DN3258_c0_g1_i3:946-1302(+)